MTPQPPQRPYPQPAPVPPHGYPPGQPHGQPQHHGPPQGHPPHGYQPGAPPPVVKPPLPAGVEAHRGITVLVLGAVGVMTFIPFFGAAAWIMGSADLRKIAAGTMDPEGYFFTRVGRICGIISTVLGVLWLAAVISMFLLPFVMMFFQSS